MKKLSKQDRQFYINYLMQLQSQLQNNIRFDVQIKIAINTALIGLYAISMAVAIPYGHTGYVSIFWGSILLAVSIWELRSSRKSKPRQFSNNLQQQINQEITNYFENKPEKKISQKSKEDSKFQIQFDQANRDFLSNTTMFLNNFGISILAIGISVVSFIIAIQGINRMSIIMSCIILLLVLIFVIKISKKSKQTIKNAKNINKQLQEKLFEMYPDYKNKFH